MIEFAKASNPDIVRPKFFFYVERISDVLNRKCLVNFFTPCERYTLIDVPDNLKGEDFIGLRGDENELDVLSDLICVHICKKDKTKTQLEKTLPDENTYVYGVYKLKDADYLLLVKLVDNALIPPFRMDEEFIIEDDCIANYTEKKPLRTDVGKFLVNYICFAEPLGSAIPYINGLITSKKIDEEIAKLLTTRKIGRKEYNKVMNNLFWFADDGSIFTAALSEKTVGYDPKLNIKRKELLEQYKDQMNDPVVLAKIEKELADIENAYIAGDESEMFFKAAGGKTLEARKKFFCIFGMTNSFGTDKPFEFTTETLQEGWNATNFSNGCNEIRRGSYGRGKETAKGGAESKFILRIFQEVKITEEDCGDRRGMEIRVTNNNKRTLSLRYTTSGELLTDEKLDALVGKKVRIRSPMSCRTKNGFCFKCCGNIFEQTQQRAIGMQTLTITSAFTADAMKAMHVSKVETAELNDLNQYIVDV